MAKQIYIDSNGNEVLVSGTITNDNNLPHFSGTPTSGTTAEAIANLDDSKQDKMLILSGEVSGTGGIMAAGVVTYNVTFSKTFKTVPRAMICFKSSASQFLSTEIQKCCIVSVSTTGMDIISSCATNRYATIIWQAIGEEA